MTKRLCKLILYESENIDFIFYFKKISIYNLDWNKLTNKIKTKKVKEYLLKKLLLYSKFYKLTCYENNKS